jgi:hypothetical protein
MKLAFKKVADKLRAEPDTVHLITTAGLKETPLGSEWN